MIRQKAVVGVICTLSAWTVVSCLFYPTQGLI
jgi:hypothetical protein